MFRFLARYLRPEIHVTRHDQLREGLAVLEGVIRSPEPVLVSPFRSTRCAAYVYTALCAVKTRQGYAQQLIKKATVYTPFELELEGGTVHATPAKPTPPVTAEEHRERQSSAPEGFAVLEETVGVGRRVELRGMVVEKDGQLVVRFDAMTPLEGGEEGEGRRSAGSARRKKGKRA